MAPLSDTDTFVSNEDLMINVSTETVNLTTCTKAFMHLHWSAKTSSENYTRLLRDLKEVQNVTQKDS